jgi:hypothetical protein
VGSMPRFPSRFFRWGQRRVAVGHPKPLGKAPLWRCEIHRENIGEPPENIPRHAGWESRIPRNREATHVSRSSPISPIPRMSSTRLANHKNRPLRLTLEPDRHLQMPAIDISQRPACRSALACGESLSSSALKTSKVLRSLASSRSPKEVRFWASCLPLSLCTRAVQRARNVITSLCLSFFWIWNSVLNTEFIRKVYVGDHQHIALGASENHVAIVPVRRETPALHVQTA